MAIYIDIICNDSTEKKYLTKLFRDGIEGSPGYENSEIALIDGNGFRFTLRVGDDLKTKNDVMFSKHWNPKT